MDNQVVLVTGSSKGIGKATIIEFAKRGYNVVINYNNSEQEANELKQYIDSTFNVKTLLVKADVTNENQVKDMVTAIMNEFEHIDVLVNNAGIAIDKEFEDRTIEDWDATLKTNLIAPFIVSKYIGKEMMKQKKGIIINVSSTN